MGFPIARTTPRKTDYWSRLECDEQGLVSSHVENVSCKIILDQTEERAANTGSFVHPIKVKNLSTQYYFKNALVRTFPRALTQDLECIAIILATYYNEHLVGRECLENSV